MTLLSAIFKRTIPFLPSCFQAILGAAVGTFLLCALSRIRLTLGSDANVTVSILFAVSLSVLGANWVITKQWFRKPATSAFCLAAFWIILQPSLLNNLHSLYQRFSLASVTQSGTAFYLSLMTCLIAVGPIIFACYSLLFVKDDQSSTQFQAPALFGLALSWLFVPVGIVPWLGMMTTTVFAALVGTASIFGLKAFTNARTLSQSVHRENTSSLDLASDLLLCMFCGSGFVLAMHLGQLLLASSLYLEFTLWAGLGLGGMLAYVCQRTFVFRPNLFSGIGIACWFAFAVIGFPWLVYSTLSISTWVSQTWMIFAYRSLILVGLTVPLGYCLGQAIFRKTFQNEAEATSLATLLFTTGFAMTIWSQPSITGLVLTMCLAGCGTSFLAWGLHRFQLPHQTILRVLPVAGVVIAVSGCFLTSRYKPSLSERVLFSGQVFASLRNGVNANKLPWMDDSRLTAEFENTQGRWSLLQHRSSQLVVKHNGLSIDYISSSPDICPQNVSEVCPVLLPLVLHPAADNVLVIGLHGSTLKTCAEFPLRSVLTVESDPAAQQVVSALKQQHIIPDDSTQHFIYANLQLALASTHAEQYDVIVCPSPQVMEANGAAQFLPGYYRSIAKHLSADGIFSQRVPYYDLGPATIQTITKSMQSVFPQVMMTEPVAGEIVFLATKHTAPLVTEQVVERLQYPQARRVLSQIGWDWSVPLSRGALNSESLTELTGHTSTPSLLDCRLAFTLPVEISRWGHKSQNTRITLSKYGKTLGTFLGDVPEAKEISERLQDLRLAQKVLTEHPDQFWAYRSVLKKQLKDRPRAKVMTIKHEGVKRALHPEDQRRKDYLIALGKAATQEHPSLAEIEAVSEFATDADFDPLVNYFVHHEVALLCERAADPVPNLELYHRLHAIYFAPAQEKSVRDVCRTIHLLTQAEDLTLSDQQRWNHLNGLLEIMKQRWRVRISDSRHASSYEPIDTEKSIEAIEAALATLDALRDDHIVSLEVWETRKELLDDHLLRPLRRHRSNQLNSYAVTPTE